MSKDTTKMGVIDTDEGIVIGPIILGADVPDKDTLEERVQFLEAHISYLEQTVANMSKALARLDVASEESRSSRKNCPRCQRAVQDSATHCGLCGAIV